jgi:hypothetical protein
MVVNHELTLSPHGALRAMPNVTYLQIIDGNFYPNSQVGKASRQRPAASPIRATTELHIACFFASSLGFTALGSHRYNSVHGSFHLPHPLSSRQWQHSDTSPSSGTLATTMQRLFATDISTKTVRYLRMAPAISLSSLR